MHFYYLDEAGCTGPDITNSQQPIFVLGGISVSDERWNKTNEKYGSIIKQCFHGPPPPNFELHAHELLSPDGEGPFASQTRDQRNSLALALLDLIIDRQHSIHAIAIDKSLINGQACLSPLPYDCRIPYLLAYDYLIGHINQTIKATLGSTACGLLILGVKDQFESKIEEITRTRRFLGSKRLRIQRIVEFSYPVESSKNPMVQITDLVVYCIKRFLEIELGYCPGSPVEAKNFYAECYDRIDSRIGRKTLFPREGNDFTDFNRYVEAIQARPRTRWRRFYPTT